MNNLINKIGNIYLRKQLKSIIENYFMCDPVWFLFKETKDSLEIYVKHIDLQKYSFIYKIQNEELIYWFIQKDLYFKKLGELIDKYLNELSLKFGNSKKDI